MHESAERPARQNASVSEAGRKLMETVKRRKVEVAALFVLEFILYFLVEDLFANNKPGLILFHIGVAVLVFSLIAIIDFKEAEENITYSVDASTERLKKLQNAFGGLLAAVTDEAHTRSLILETLQFADVTLASGDAHSVWARLTWAMRKSYSATVHAVPCSMYREEYDKLLTVQEAKAKCDLGMNCVPFTKVFIVEKEDELGQEVLHDVIARGLSSGMKLSWIPLARADEMRVQRKLEYLDFSIFDDEITLCWILDDKRDVKGLKLLVGKSRSEPYKQFLSALKQEGKAMLSEPQQRTEGTAPLSPSSATAA